MITVEAWLAALEGGEYMQGRGALRIPDDSERGRFCCLGVACDVNDPDRWVAHSAHSSAVDYRRLGVSIPTGSFLPDDVRMALGLTHENGAFKTDDLPDDIHQDLAKVWANRPPFSTVDRELPAIASLSDVNDKGGSFALIARIIRARPKGLFIE